MMNSKRLNLFLVFLGGTLVRPFCHRLVVIFLAGFVSYLIDSRLLVSGYVMILCTSSYLGFKLLILGLFQALLPQLQLKSGK
jgi:hypothetical protein